MSATPTSRGGQPSIGGSDAPSQEPKRETGPRPACSVQMRRVRARSAKTSVCRPPPCPVSPVPGRFLWAAAAAPPRCSKKLSITGRSSMAAMSFRPPGSRLSPVAVGRVCEITNARFVEAKREKPRQSVGQLWSNLAGRFGSKRLARVRLLPRIEPSASGIRRKFRRIGRLKSIPRRRSIGALRVTEILRLGTSPRGFAVARPASRCRRSVHALPNQCGDLRRMAARKKVTSAFDRDEMRCRDRVV